MDIELRYFDGCPNWQATRAEVERLVEGLGLDVTFTTRRVETPDEAVELGFTGSPTLIIDGEDPFAEPGAPAGLACRIYRTEDGMAGMPSPEQLRSALLTHAT